MPQVLLPVVSLLLSVAVLLLGHGLQLVLLPLRADGLGWSAAEIGYTGSAYFLGFVVGCLSIPRLIARVGHIRTFAVLAAIATAALLSMALYQQLFAWLLLRFLSGWALSGLYMVIESWLNEKAPTEHRGKILSLYTVITLLGIGAAQLLIGLAPPDAATLFMLGAVLLCLSIVPVSLTRTIIPHPLPQVKFNPRKLFHNSQVAVVCGLLGGMITGSFWALGPVFAGRMGMPLTSIGIFMATVVLGGALFQFPFGRLSDLMDRRRIILALTIFGAVAALLCTLVATLNQTLLLILAFFFGGAAMPLYSLCVAHANDHISESDFVEVASGILLMNSIGSVIGPAITATLMTLLGPQALFGFAGISFTLAALWTSARLRAAPREREHFQPFTSLPDTTQVAIDLDPRSDEDNPDQHVSDDQYPTAHPPG